MVALFTPVRMVKLYAVVLKDHVGKIICALAGFITFILIIVVETFVVFIQTLRLHWVEWFYLFYKGKGTEFKAFKF